MAAKKKALKRKAQVQQHSFAGRTAGAKGVAELEIDRRLAKTTKWPY